MSYRFPKKVRLRKRHQFQRFANRCNRAAGQWIIIESRSNHTLITRLGITVTKRFGKANERNRFKRIVREAFRQCQMHLPQGLDLNIKPRTYAKKATSANIQQDLLQFGADHVSRT